MEIQDTKDVINFELPRLLVGLAHALETPLRVSETKLTFEFGPELETVLRGNCQRLGETLTNLVKGAIAHPDYGDILMAVHSEPLGFDRVLLRFEITPVNQEGPTFRFYAGLPRAVTHEHLSRKSEIRA